MNLLTGMMSNYNTVNNLNTTITGYSQNSNTTSGITITGANSGQIYVACHYAYNSSGISTAPSTLSGFTSLSSYAQSGSIYSFRLSYRILTSNQSTFTFPSVSGTNGQIIFGLVYTPLSGTATSLNLASEVGYNYSTSSTTVSGEVSPRAGDISIGIGALYPNTGAGGSTFPSPRLDLAIASGGAALGDYLGVLASKVSTSSESISWFLSGSGSTTTLSNTFVLRPTFS